VPLGRNQLLIAPHGLFRNRLLIHALLVVHTHPSVALAAAAAAAALPLAVFMSPNLFNRRVRPTSNRESVCARTRSTVQPASDTRHASHHLSRHGFCPATDAVTARIRHTRTHFVRNARSSTRRAALRCAALRLLYANSVDALVDNANFGSHRNDVCAATRHSAAEYRQPLQRQQLRKNDTEMRVRSGRIEMRCPPCDRYYSRTNSRRTAAVNTVASYRCPR
jgi:hypothetical protein